MSDGSNTPIDEGYVKYQSDWTISAAPDAGLVAKLNEWRRPLFDATLIGHYAELGIGYGNLSIRAGGSQFVISGTQTGHIESTNGDHYALVTAVDIDANRVCCSGPVQASSEALTHAALYALDTKIGAVVHVHNGKLWQRHKHRLPTTGDDVAYGTPAMAREFRRLWDESDFPLGGLAVMAGHDEGLVSIGRDLREATERMLELYGSS